MDDKVKTKAAKAKVVFLPGYGQVTFDPKSKDKAKSAPEVPAEHLDRLVEEGAIEKPKGYQTPAERQAEADKKAAVARAEATAPTEVTVELKTFEMAGFTFTEAADGKATITGASLDAELTFDAVDAAKSKLAELVAEALTEPEPQNVAGSGNTSAPD